MAKSILSELVANRRSCRIYSEEKIPEAIMNKCLDLALNINSLASI